MITVTKENVAGIKKKMLQKKLWVIITKDVAPTEEVHALSAAHIQYQISLEERGIMFGAGGLRKPDGTRVAGQIVIRAKDEAEARAIADADPRHIAGVRTYELFEWSMNEGGFNIRVRFSDRSYVLD
jgi:uncharacterized protein YciI